MIESRVTPVVAADGRPLVPTAAVVTLLAALSGLGQFAGNAYLPALPSVADDLMIGMPQVQWTMAVFLIGFALSQLIYGPLSDRHGRIRPLMVGLVLFLIGSIGSAMAGSLDTLLAARLIQGLGAGSGVVIARAIVRDSFEGAELARIMTLIAMIFALVPGFSPLVGGLVTGTVGWAAVFWLCALFGVVAMAGAMRLPETNRDPLARMTIGVAVGGFREVAGNRTYLAFALPAALVIGSLSAFFAGSPAVLIDGLGISPVEFGFYPPIAIAGFFIGGGVARRLAGRWPPLRIVGLGLSVMLAGVVVMLLPVAAGLVHEWHISVAMVIHVAGLGLLMPTAVAAALSAVQRLAGTASAFLGFLQMAIGAAATLLVSVLQPTWPVLAFPAVMALCTGLAGLTLLLGRTWIVPSPKQIDRRDPDAP